MKVISLDYILEYAKKNNCLVQMAELVEQADKDGKVVDLKVYQDQAEERAWNIAREKVAGKVKQWKKDSDELYHLKQGIKTLMEKYQHK